MRFTTLILLLLVGCKNFTTVDEACKDKVGGEKNTEDPLDIDSIIRVNCYRRVAGISLMNFEAALQQATVSHVEYIMLNDGIEGGTWGSGVETAGQPGYTGASLGERMESAGFLRGLAGMGIWQFFWIDDFKGPDRVDFWFPHPWARDAYLQPSVRMVGYHGVDTDDGYLMAHMIILYDDPSVEGSSRPFIYPKNGQTDTEGFFAAPDLANPLYPLGTVGYPITLTMGGAALEVVKHSLKGPAGAVETTLYPVGTAGGNGGVLRSTAFVLPDEVLEPGAEYTFEATIRVGTGGDVKVESLFTVSNEKATSDDVASARQTPRIWMTHDFFPDL